MSEQALEKDPTFGPEDHAASSAETAPSERGHRRLLALGRRGGLGVQSLAKGIVTTDRRVGVKVLPPGGLSKVTARRVRLRALDGQPGHVSRSRGGEALANDGETTREELERALEVLEGKLDQALVAQRRLNQTIEGSIRTLERFQSPMTEAKLAASTTNS